MNVHRYKVIVTITALLGLCGMFVWHEKGRLQGRAEMKRWQDSYYRTHPVKKETSVKDDGSLVIYGDNLPNSCEQKIGYMECSYKIRAISKAPAPPKKAKPAKRRKAGLPIPVCAQHYDDGKTEFARCQPAKANCSMPLNHGTATVYWPPREDGKCYPQDSPFQP